MGWLQELFLTPAVIFLLLFGLAFAFAGSRPYAFEIAAYPAVLCLLPNVTFFLHIQMERWSSRADILYLRNYAKRHFFEHTLTRDTGALQMLVRGILRPPFDTVSLFPPASTPEDERRDRRSKLKRGVHHVFTLRTKDDDTWKAAVEYLLKVSRIVIVECGQIDGGFAWELGRIPEFADPGKVLMVSDKDGQQHAEEIRRRLQGADGRHDEIPLFVIEPGAGNNFKDNLITAVRERASDFDEVAQERAPAILVEIVLKLLTMVFTVVWWLSIVVAVVAVAMLTV